MSNRFAKSLAMGICLTLLFAGVAYAGQTEPASGSGTSGYAGKNTENPKEVLEKQSEIDQYVFETNADDIAAKGFKVTHTGPFETYVEIGITPYREDNAEYLYGIFGRELVKVVEGQQAVILNASPDDAEAPDLAATSGLAETGEDGETIQDAELYTTSGEGNSQDDDLQTVNTEEEEKESSGPVWMGIAGAAMVLGSLFAVFRKKAAVQK